MDNISKVKEFFEKLSAASSTSDSSSMKLLNGQEMTRFACINGPLQDRLIALTSATRSSAVEFQVDDYGVGLPPLANV